MPKFKAPQTHNVVWLHAHGVTVLDRESGVERPFFRYAFKLVSDDPKVIHIGAIQTNNRMQATAAINSLISTWDAKAHWAGTMQFEDLGPAIRAWR